MNCNSVVCHCKPAYFSQLTKGPHYVDCEAKNNMHDGCRSRGEGEGTRIMRTGSACARAGNRLAFLLARATHQFLSIIMYETEIKWLRNSMLSD